MFSNFFSLFKSSELQDNQQNNESSIFSFGGKVAYANQSLTTKKPYDCLFKVVMIGDGGVGKSCCVKRFVDNSFHSEDFVSTIGCEFGTKTVSYNGTLVKLQIWDTAGQERFRSITRSYYRGAHGILYCYDITNYNSFKNIINWMESGHKDACLILIGTKLDLESKRQVSYNEAYKFAKEHNLLFYEISSKTGKNITEAFNLLTSHMAQKENINLDYSTPDYNPNTKSNNIDYGSDEECFSDDEFEQELDDLVVNKKISSQNKHNKYSKTNVNICQLSLGNLQEKRDIITGDPVFCKNCGVIFNSFSSLLSKNDLKKENKKRNLIKLIPAPPLHPILEEFADKEQPSSISDDYKYWECEFCLGLNIVDLEDEEIPKQSSMDYIAKPSPNDNSSSNYSNIVFCIDTSGSMCVTSELTSKINLKGLHKREKQIKDIRKSQDNIGEQYLPGQNRNVTMVSRLQCVQSAVEHQINKYVREHPDYHIGLVTFDSEVSLIGDGTQDSINVGGDKLYSWDQLQKIGNNFTINNPISQSKDILSEKLWDLEENGSTALGPALQLSICIAGSKPGSHVILCTDGLANVGIGSLEGKETDYTPIYTELAEQALLKGVTVSVISLIGSECCLNNLSIVTDKTGGLVTRVNPLQLEGELSTINNKPIIGYSTMAMIILHRGLRFQNEFDGENENRNYVVKDLGNIRSDTDLSFQYSFRSKEEFDLSYITEIPFQVQISYITPNGEERIRIENAKIPVTNDRNKAEQNANLNIIETHTAQRAALFARDGDYEKAQMETRSAQRFMMRNGVKKERISQWTHQVKDVDNVIRKKRKQNINKPTSYIDDSTIAVVSKQRNLKFS